MLTVVPRERYDCPACGSMHIQLIGRGRTQVVLRCMQCRGWFGIGDPSPRIERDPKGLTRAHQVIEQPGCDDGSATIVAGARSSVG